MTEYYPVYFTVLLPELHAFIVDLVALVVELDNLTALSYEGLLGIERLIRPSAIFGVGFQCVDWQRCQYFQSSQTGTRKEKSSHTNTP